MSDGHTPRAHFQCEESGWCDEDCFDGDVCEECTLAEDRAVWWPCAAAQADDPVGDGS